MLDKGNMYYLENDQWIAEYVGGFIFLANKETKQSGVTRILNGRGQSISLDQFNDGCRSHSFDKACEVFWKLRAREEKQ